MNSDPVANRDVLPTGYTFHWYEIISVLGRGAFGVTYLARDTNLDQFMAIKEYFPVTYATRVTGYTVHPTEGENRDMYQWGLERFIKEARTLAKFKHPNIVRVNSVFEHNNTAYMVMEYEQGADLSHIYKLHDKNLSEQELLDIFLPVLDGLTLVHNAGFIHRDIKPANIFIRQEGAPVLIDFGSARQVSSDLTRPVTSLVTHGYAPFEQFNEAEEKQGPWTDIYSLGACIYLAINGKLPIDALSRGSKILTQGVDPYEPLSFMPPSDDYSPHFLRAIDHALHFHAVDRPQNAVTWSNMLSGTIETPPFVPTHASQGVDGDEDHPTVLVGKPTGGSGIEVITPKDTNGIGQNHGNRQDESKPGTASLKYALLAVLVIVAIISVGISYLTPNTTLTLRSPPSPQTLQHQANASSVADLLVQADKQLNTQHLLKPAGENAYESYNKILQLDPGNTKARTGIGKIGQALAARANNQFNRGDLEASLKTVRQGLMIAPDNKELLALNSQTHAKLAAIRDQAKQQQEVNRWLTEAKQSFDEGKLINPDGENALFFYRQALNTDPGNIAAEHGIHNIDDSLEKNFSQMLSADNLTGAEMQLTAIDKAMPNSTLARDLRTRWERHKTNFDKQAINKMIDRFKSAFEDHKFSLLNRISEYRPGRKNFVKLIMKNYSSYKVMVFDVRSIGGLQQKIATVRINELFNKDGGPVQPGSWSRFEIEIKKNRIGKWKVYW